MKNIRLNRIAGSQGKDVESQAIEKAIVLDKTRPCIEELYRADIF